MALFHNTGAGCRFGRDEQGLLRFGGIPIIRTQVETNKSIGRVSFWDIYGTFRATDFYPKDYFTASFHPSCRVNAFPALRKRKLVMVRPRPSWERQAVF